MKRHISKCFQSSLFGSVFLSCVDALLYLFSKIVPFFEQKPVLLRPIRLHDYISEELESSLYLPRESMYTWRNIDNSTEYYCSHDCSTHQSV